MGAPFHMKTQKWHLSSTGTHQALIIAEDGQSIAVAYDKENGPIIAAAPELLAFCAQFVAWSEERALNARLASGALLRAARAALASASNL